MKNLTQKTLTYLAGLLIESKDLDPEVIEDLKGLISQRPFSLSAGSRYLKPRKQELTISDGKKSYASAYDLVKNGTYEQLIPETSFFTSPSKAAKVFEDYPLLNQEILRKEIQVLVPFIDKSSKDKEGNARHFVLRAKKINGFRWPDSVTYPIQNWDNDTFCKKEDGFVLVLPQ